MNDPQPTPCRFCGRIFTPERGPGPMTAYCRPSHRRRAYEFRRLARLFSLAGPTTVDRVNAALIGARPKLRKAVEFGHRDNFERAWDQLVTDVRLAFEETADDG